MLTLYRTEIYLSLTIINYDNDLRRQVNLTITEVTALLAWLWSLVYGLVSLWQSLPVVAARTWFLMETGNQKIIEWLAEPVEIPIWLALNLCSKPML